MRGTASGERDIGDREGAEGQAESVGRERERGEARAGEGGLGG